MPAFRGHDGLVMIPCDRHRLSPRAMRSGDALAHSRRSHGDGGSMSGVLRDPLAAFSD
jgi:hypothetical protein